ncbi:hypothetical protein F4804DRAFT_296082 [Jackrogersella minutella]|nr:hypothetical protein F4804DRAFT_296082 [Jackrogersella minutella]
MAEEHRQTPIPVPYVYGQPSQSNLQQTTAEMANHTDNVIPLTHPDIEFHVTAAALPNTNAPHRTNRPPTTDEVAEDYQAAAPAPAASASNAPSPAGASASTANPPARTGTPYRNTNGGQETTASTSRAASAHPDPGFILMEAPLHGAPVRQYLNSKVTGPLLDGMKIIAKEQPQEPLRVLGEYLIQRSKDLESAST